MKLVFCPITVSKSRADQFLFVNSFTNSNWLFLQQSIICKTTSCIIFFRIIRFLHISLYTSCKKGMIMDDTPPQDLRGTCLQKRFLYYAIVRHILWKMKIITVRWESSQFSRYRFSHNFVSGCILWAIRIEIGFTEGCKTCNVKVF